MEDGKCFLNEFSGVDCWVDLVLRGANAEGVVATSELLANCVKCKNLNQAITRSTGRRSSDRLISLTVSKLLSVLSSYDSELSSTARSLQKKVEELTVLKTVSEALLKASTLRESLKVFLTGVTAGEAFAFNRAVVFLVNQPKRALEGQIGLGHVDYESYNRT